MCSVAGRFASKFVPTNFIMLNIKKQLRFAASRKPRIASNAMKEPVDNPMIKSYRKRFNRRRAAWSVRRYGLPFSRSRS